MEKVRTKSKGVIKRMRELTQRLREKMRSDEGEEQSEPDLVGEEEVDSDASLGETNSGDSTEAMDADDDEPMALQPIRMYLPAAEYKKKIKLGTRCYIKEVLTTFDKLKHPLTTFERNWFENHSQFKHIWHLPRDKNHKVMGMWMLLLRTACIEKKREVWFVVNGVPIRYGIKEHALLSGFNCRNYPIDYNKVGSKTFVNNHFSSKKVTREEVREKLKEMVPMERSRDRLKMAVLYFLSSIVRAPVKTGEQATEIDEFLQKAVNDLNFCKTFPWGRYSFDYMLESIAHTMDHFHGTVTKGVLWPVAGLCILLELLAFEAIQHLRNQFVEDNPGAHVTCPRMCRRKFKKCELRGFSLERINDELGTIKDIDSFLIPEDDNEKSLLAGITEEDDVDDAHDVVVNSWMQRYLRGYHVWFENMFNEDVQSRAGVGGVGGEPENVNEEIALIEGPVYPSVSDLVDLLNTFKNEMGEKMKGIVDRLNGWEEKVATLGERVASLEEKSKTREDTTGPADTGDHSDLAPKDTAGLANPPPKRMTRSSRNQG
ncbi:PREDICTED: uncharacterized protein At3g43530-like [Camelina sativa]|uniref:Uncharacterized protein At3g43530-like n=1 Tax=Camelina sativa TaxID=90675 RepID=A0ABM1QW61_CAMSA|nr:PREDICTED: uncharacterized protein At3g43530-like [Camelina sativa]